MEVTPSAWHYMSLINTRCQAPYVNLGRGVKLDIRIMFAMAGPVATAISEQARWLIQEVSHSYYLSDEKAQAIVDSFESQGSLRERDLRNILGGVVARDEYVEAVAKAAGSLGFVTPGAWHYMSLVNTRCQAPGVNRASAGVLAIGVAASEAVKWWGLGEAAVEIPTVGSVLAGGAVALGIASMALNPWSRPRPGFRGNDINSIIYFKDDTPTMTFTITEPIFTAASKPLAMSATPSVSESPAALESGGYAATPPPEQDPKNEKPRMREAMWWKPWRVPKSVEEEMASIFRSGDLSLDQKHTEAAKVLLRWRLSRIPDPARRESALRVMEKSFKESHVLGRTIRTREDVQAWVEEVFSVFSEPVRRDAHRTLGGFRKGMSESGSDWIKAVGLSDLTGRFKELSRVVQIENTSGAVMVNGEVWINPYAREIQGGSAVANVVTHEVGGHVGARDGAYGPLSSLWGRIGGNPFLQVVDPLQPVTRRIFTFVAESEGIGAQWEYVHRIPQEIRREQMASIRRELGENADLLNTPPDAVSRRDSVWARTQNFEQFFRLAHRVMEYRYLEGAELPKREYLRFVQRVIGHAPDQLIYLPTQQAWRVAYQQQEYPPLFWVPFAFQTAKAAAATGAAIWAVKRFSKED